MKIKNQLLTFLIALLFLPEAKSQIPEAVWYKNFGGSHKEYDGNDRSLYATTDGGYVWERAIS
ncbi:MAG: hypothetical protein SH856_00675 [Flavobacteriales bacterium]|nr:hypothetical protein [Flavobacteriales bacterium]